MNDLAPSSPPSSPKSLQSSSPILAPSPTGGEVVGDLAPSLALLPQTDRAEAQQREAS